MATTRTTAALASPAAAVGDEDEECGRGAGRGFSNRSAGFGFLETAR